MRTILATAVALAMMVLSVGAVPAVQAQTAESDSYCPTIERLDRQSRSAVEYGLTQNGYAHSEPRARDLLAYPHSVATLTIAIIRGSRLAGLSTDISWHIRTEVDSLMQDNVGTNIALSAVGERNYRAEMAYCSIPVRVY
jgi:hypothetical protein